MDSKKSGKADDDDEEEEVIVYIDTNTNTKQQRQHNLSSRHPIVEQNDAKHCGNRKRTLDDFLISGKSKQDKTHGKHGNDTKKYTRVGLKYNPTNPIVCCTTNTTAVPTTTTKSNNSAPTIRATTSQSIPHQKHEKHEKQHQHDVEDVNSPIRKKMAIQQASYVGGSYFIPKSHISTAELDEELFVSKQSFMAGSNANNPIQYRLYDSNDATFYAVPKFYGLAKYGPVPLVNDYTQKHTKKQIDKAKVLFTGKLVTSPVQQITGVEKMLRHLCNPETFNGGMLICPCGGGKTVMGTYLWHALGLMGMIIVQDGGIASQWEETIQAFCPMARIGYLQGKNDDLVGNNTSTNITKNDGDDFDIIIAMSQTLALRDYGYDILGKIGTVIVDEMHHSGANTRALAIRKIPATYTIGVTATPYRNDGLTHALSWFLGPPVVQLEKEPMPCTVYMLTYCDDRKLDLRNRKGDPLWSAMYDTLVMNYERNCAIVSKLMDVLEREPTRRVFVWSKRISHLETLYKIYVQKLQQKYGIKHLQSTNDLPDLVSPFVGQNKNDDGDGEKNSGRSNGVQNANNTNNDDDDDDVYHELTLCQNDDTPAPRAREKKGAQKKGPSKFDPIAWYNCTSENDKKLLVSFGWYVGSPETPSQQSLGKKAQILFGANKLEEGMNDPTRDTLFVTLPHGKDIVQLEGRLQRIYPDKNSLKIFHIHDTWAFFDSMGWGCYKTYKSLPLHYIVREPLI